MLLARVIAFCSWVRHLTLTVLLFTQECRFIPATHAAGIAILSHRQIMLQNFVLSNKSHEPFGLKIDLTSFERFINR